MFIARIICSFLKTGNDNQMDKLVYPHKNIPCVYTYMHRKWTTAEDFNMNESQKHIKEWDKSYKEAYNIPS